MDSHFISNPNFRLTYSGSLGSLDIIFKQSHNEDLRKIIDKMQTPRSILELSESHQKPNLFETVIYIYIYIDIYIYNIDRKDFMAAEENLYFRGFTLCISESSIQIQFIPVARKDN